MCVCVCVCVGLLPCLPFPSINADGSFVQEVETRLRMLAAAQEELPEEPSGGGEEGEGLRRALREAQEQGRGVQEQLFQVTFDVCKHVKDLGGCGRCLSSGVRGLQVLEEVAEKVQNCDDLLSCVAASLRSPREPPDPAVPLLLPDHLRNVKSRWRGLSTRRLRMMPATQPAGDTLR